jgi:hypothetical protein
MGSLVLFKDCKLAPPGYWSKAFERDTAHETRSCRNSCYYGTFILLNPKLCRLVAHLLLRYRYLTYPVYQDLGNIVALSGYSDIASR